METKIKKQKKADVSGTTVAIIIAVILVIIGITILASKLKDFWTVIQ